MTRSSVERAVTVLLRLTLRVFFRGLEVSGAGRIPRRGPVLLIANHVNGLVDPFLLMALARRPLRIVAKHTLWQVPVLRAFLRAMDAIPVHRAGEDPDARRRNEAFFEACVGVLESGGALAIFPEGRSHSEPGPQPLRTGAARIALAAAARGAAPAVVPVGLNYERKERFRSDVVALVGAPVRAEEGEGAPKLTERFAAGLREVVVGLDTWEDHRLLALLVSLQDPGAAGEAAVRRRLAAARAYARLRGGHAVEIEGLRADLQRLRDRCRAIGVSPARLEQRTTAAGAARWTLTRLEILIGLPLALWGLAASWAPYRLTGIVAARVPGDADHAAMYKILGGLALFPAAYALEAGLAWALAGPLAGAAFALLVVPCGYYALRWWEAGAGAIGDARAFLRLAARRDEVRELRRERAEILDRVDRLGEALSASGR